MRLYSASSQQFVKDAVQNSIAEKLSDAFFRQCHYRPSPAEVGSWRNSLRAMCLVVQGAHLDDHGVMLEYQLPMSSRRLDCLLCGKGGDSKDAAIIVELKQWDRCTPAEGESEVVSWVGGSLRELLHPSVQVGQYRTYLEDTHTAFYDGADPVRLSACAYLHNYTLQDPDPLLDPKFGAVTAANPMFVADGAEALSEHLAQLMPNGRGLETLARIEDGSYRPSRKLMDHVAEMIKGHGSFTLLDEQLVVFDKVLALARKGFHDRRKSVLIIRGGPGTGKSVVAINLMGKLLGDGYNVHYATGSRAFTMTLRKIIGPRGSAQFKYFNSYMKAELNAIDVLVCDEAHRIRRTSDDRYTRKEDRSGRLQIEELIAASKVSVFFIDDQQSVQPKEVGQGQMIRENAEKLGCSVHEYELAVQFRCRGSEAFVNWIDNTLGVRQTANVLWTGADGFEFRVLDCPEALEDAIKAKVQEGFSGRLTAGFCWKWSLTPKADGTLEDDVVIGDFRRPWNARPETTRLAKGIPKATLWAYTPEGINQIGCVYTAQGFEFDYVGVIVGPDLRYDMDAQMWIGDRSKSADTTVSRAGELFTELVKKTYRVLMSRGLRGCYVHFMDKDTERFFKSRMQVPVDTGTVPLSTSDVEFVDIVELETTVGTRETMLPVYSLQAAAGYFDNGQTVEAVGWVRPPEGLRADKRLFVAKVVGRSMEPDIPDGSYCVFRSGVAGTRQGRVVLSKLTKLGDPETGAAFTVKRYSSTKVAAAEDGWRHERIVLSPINPDFTPIILEPDAEGSIEVVAEFVRVLGRARPE